MKYRELTEKIIGVFYDVYQELGHGFLERVYEQAMSLGFVQAGMRELRIERKVSAPVWFGGQPMGDFRADILVEAGFCLNSKRPAPSIRRPKSSYETIYGQPMLKLVGC